MSKYAKCLVSGCIQKAEFICNTDQLCEEHMNKFYGSGVKIGQAAILAHNVKFNLNYLLVEEITDQND
ncbi:MAG: hypothetical protein ABTQ25_01730 [Nitrosomonas ureae]